MDEPYCGQCGLPVEGDDAAGEAGKAGGSHRACAERARLEPPRFCTQCRRRMVVQVVPRGWSARCVEHGVRRS